MVRSVACSRLFFLFALVVVLVNSEPITSITIDGDFSDWDAVPSYYDPADAQDGSVLQGAVPDVHDTDHTECDTLPLHVWNPDVDILEYKFTHDADTFYAFIRAAGNISRTMQQNINDNTTRAGRSYIQVAIDMDNIVDTGYCLCDGGYWPSYCGADMHFELEMYNGTFNTAHYLLHSMTDNITYQNAYRQQQQGYVVFGNGTYHPYTEWVYWDSSNPMTADELARCPDGPYETQFGGQLCFVEDKVGGPFQGVMQYAFSSDFHTVEFSAPFRGFLHNLNGSELIQYGMKLDIYFSLETSSEYSVPNTEWATDSTWPIRGYLVEPPVPGDVIEMKHTHLAGAIVGSLLGGGLLAGVAMYFFMRNRGYAAIH